MKDSKAGGKIFQRRVNAVIADKVSPNRPWAYGWSLPAVGCINSAAGVESARWWLHQWRSWS